MAGDSAEIDGGKEMRQSVAAAVAGLALALLAGGCQSRGELDNVAVRIHPNDPVALARGEKTFVFPELRSGRCTMRPGATLVLTEVGTSRWDAKAWTTGESDRWDMWVEVAASNGWPLFTLPPDRSGEKPEVYTLRMPAPRTDYDWQERNWRFDPTKYRHIDEVRIFYRC
ncbi:hypothetical protein ABIE65_001514 [Constrictibacter sp. MBR-5]|jgi:hypothetical protein